MGFELPLWPLKVAFVFSFAGVGSEQWFMGFFWAVAFFWVTICHAWMTLAVLLGFFLE